MNKRTYKEYLKGNHWRNIKKEFYKVNERRCIECGSTNDLNIHHLTYDRLGKERLTDLVCLCEKCHKELHKKLGGKSKPKKLKPKKKVYCTNCKWFKFGYYCDKYNKSAPYGKKMNCRSHKRK